MSFSNTLNRLREAAKGARSSNGDVFVSAYDLRDLLNDYDRINEKLRNESCRTVHVTKHKNLSPNGE